MNEELNECAEVQHNEDVMGNPNFKIKLPKVISNYYEQEEDKEEQKEHFNF